MKQITEFNGPMFQLAARAASKLAPAEAAPATTPAAPLAVEAVPTEGDGEAPSDEAGGAPESEAAVSVAPTDARRAQLEAAVAEATGLGGDRLSRLSEAVALFGAQAAKIRLIRVFSAAEAPGNAKKVGEFAYVSDFAVNPQASGGHRKGGRAGGRGGQRGGGGGAPGAGKNKAPTGTLDEAGTLAGRFDMDAVKQDRRRHLASSGGDGKGGRGGPGGRRGKPPQGRSPKPAGRKPAPTAP